MGRNDCKDEETTTTSDTRFAKRASSNIGMVVGLLAIISPILVLAGMWSANTNDIKALKTEQTAIRIKWEQDHDIIVRIEEQVKQIKEKVIPK